MTSIISYTLFSQSGPKFDRSTHDPLDSFQDRYWLNIPFIIVANKYIFKNITTRIYISQGIKNHKFYPLLEKLSKTIDCFEIKQVNRPVVGTEPTLWRMLPLWDDIDYCFPRDLDSVVTIYEAKIMNYFMETNFLMNNIRSLSFHNGEGTSLMAGLSGYNVKLLKNELPLPKSFDNYMKFYKKTFEKSSWGCDQETLINFFIRYRTDRIIKRILDIYVQPSPLLANPKLKGKVNANRHHNVVSSDINLINNNRLVGTNVKILQYINSLSTWSGEPINASGTPLKHLMSVINDDYTNQVKAIIQSNKMFSAFYKI